MRIGNAYAELAETLFPFQSGKSGEPPTQASSENDPASPDFQF
jgi:hypothetical protein